MRALDPRIHQKRGTVSKKMDCRVKPGNDELSQNQRSPTSTVSPRPALAGEKNNAIRR